MGICEYVRRAREEMRNGASIDRFIELRYHIMFKACPHDTFSVAQASMDFFDVAHDHILGIEELPKAEPNRPLSDYDKNYIRWIKMAQMEKA